MKRLGLALAALIWLGACGRQNSGQPLVTVNGEVIGRKNIELERRLAGLEQVDDEALLESLIDQALILQEGRRLGVTLSQDALRAAETLARAGTDDKAMALSLVERGVSVKEWRERLAQAVLADEVVRTAVRSNVEIGRQEIQDFYWEHLPSFRHGDRKVLRQIFTKTRTEAEAALQEVQLGEAFAKVAERRSQGPEASNGGLIGNDGKGRLPKVLAAAADKLKPKQVSPVIASAWGFHLLYVDALELAAGDSLEQASPVAHARLMRDKEQLLYQLWLGRLREQAKIERLVALPKLTATAKAGKK